MQVIFKPVLEKDVDQLREIAIKTFSQSYEQLNTPSNFSWYIQKAFSREKLLVEIQKKQSYYFFTTLGNQIIGYLKLNIGENITKYHKDEYLEIERIYLDTFHQRKGIGKIMVEFALEIAKESKKTKVCLGVWSQNPKAIQFYEHVGFSRKGNYIFEFGDEDQIDIIMEMIL